MRTSVWIACLVATHAPCSARDRREGTKAGDDETVAGVRLCRCPLGKVTMGSPPGETERRPGEDQVEVKPTRGSWAGEFEVTQGNGKRVVGKLPGDLTTELHAGDDYPVGNVNFVEAGGVLPDVHLSGGTARIEETST